MDEIFLEFNEIETENPGVEYLEIPEAVDSPEKKYVCVSCDKRYQAIDLLHSHMREHQSDQSVEPGGDPADSAGQRTTFAW